MCSIFCQCPGMIGDEHYDQYAKVPAETYKEYDRYFTVELDMSGDINAQIEKQKKAFYWQPKKTEGVAETMLECFENSEKIALALAADGNAGDQDVAELEVQLQSAKPSPEFISVVSQLESEYKCSGLCKEPLFYFTQSVTEGLPTQACIVPALEDIGSTLQNLGAILIVTGLLFYIMIFMTAPICFYDKVKKQTEEDEDEQVEKEIERK